jgi:hypothetical protein
MDTMIKKKFVGVRYEDLIENPKHVLQKITELVGFDFDEAMIEGILKQPNTSYKELNNLKGINSAFKDKWKEELPKEIVVQIEAYCEAEMVKLNYAKIYPDADTEISTLMEMNGIPYESLSEWCQEIVQGKKYYEGTWLTSNIYLEAVRLSLLHEKIPTDNPSLLQDFFYHQNFYHWLRSQKVLETQSV